MKSIDEMSYAELKEEIRYIASVMDDDAQAQHHAAYLADLTEAFANKAVAVQAETPERASAGDRFPALMMAGEKGMSSVKKYYADIYHAKSGAHITIGEYTEPAIERAISRCLEQRGFDPDDCIWTVRTDEV